MKIASAIEAYLIASNAREESSKPKKFYISDMGKCMRMRYLKRKGIATEFGPDVYWIFALGNMIHDFGYKALQAQGLLLQTEESMETDHFSGRFDGLVKGEDNDKPTIFDFKSSGGYAMKKAIDGADNEENIMQILTYVLLYGKLHKEISDSGTLVYLNKEPGSRTSQVIAYDRTYKLTNVEIQKIEKEMAQMTEYWLDEIIPPCTCPVWMRPYNSYLPFCSMNETDIKNYLALLKDNKKIIVDKAAIYTMTPGDISTRQEVFHL